MLGSELDALVNKTFQEYYTANIGSGGAAQLYLSELPGTLNKVNYNQGNDINALAGMVS